MWAGPASENWHRQKFFLLSNRWTLDRMTMSRKHYLACPCWQLQYKILLFLKPTTRCCLYTKPTITCVHASLNIGISLPTRKTRFSKNVHLKITKGGFIRDNTIFDCQGIEVPQRDRNQLLNTECHICHWLDVDLTWTYFQQFLTTEASVKSKHGLVV